MVQMNIGSNNSRRNHRIMDLFGLLLLMIVGLIVRHDGAGGVVAAVAELPHKTEDGEEPSSAADDAWADGGDGQTLAQEEEVSVDVTASAVYWPFSKKDDNNGTINNSCASQLTCENCTQYRTCHWCSFDSQCHTVGSRHGCLMGSSCGGKPDNDDNKKNGTEHSGCELHTNCRDCRLSSSHLCHWCAHDNACHSIGSVYGCVSGVDCYDNDHCQRKEPEPLPNNSSKMFVLPKPGAPLLVFVAVLSCLLCCTTSCCCLAGCIKGTYEDLLYDATAGSNNDLQEPLVVQVLRNLPPHSEEEEGADAEEQEHPDLEEDGEEEAEAEEEQDEEAQETVDNENTNDNDDEQDVEVATTEENQPLLAASRTTRTSRRAGREPPATTTTSTGSGVGALDPSSHHHDSRHDRDGHHQYHYSRRPRTGTIQRCYRACVVLYVVSLILIALLGIMVLRYYPQKPVYNICNDSVAWKSLMDSMTKMQVTADFELLASISNPNHVDVAIDMGKGSFAHDGAFVGTYEIPPVVIAAHAITDILIVASFRPEKWQALSITAEYYRGTLTLTVDSQTTIRIPSLFDYTFTAELNDLTVHVNENSDRHLCSCPTWSDARHNHTNLPAVIELDRDLAVPRRSEPQQEGIPDDDVEEKDDVVALG